MITKEIWIATDKTGLTKLFNTKPTYNEKLDIWSNGESTEMITVPYLNKISFKKSPICFKSN